MKNRIRFAKEDDSFLKELNLKVEKYFSENGLDKYATSYVHIKSGLLLGAYLVLSVLLYFSNDLTALYTCYILMGMLTVFIALNIGHEAAHNIFSKNKNLNKVLLYVFDLLGANGKIWKYKHVHSHHQFTNIHEVDKELQQPRIVRIFPQSQYFNFHRYQHFYMPLLYSIYTLIWFCFRDFKDYFELRYEMNKGNTSVEALVFFSGKLIFITRMIILPTMVLPFSFWQILFGFLICNLASSMTVTFALISTHVGEHSHFPEPDENNIISHSWVKHQFLTTSDFSTDNSLTTALYAGFNHHLTHHLFPFISHAHYPKITMIIREVSQKHGFVTHPQPSIIAAIRSHFVLLRRRALEGRSSLNWMEM